MPSTNKWREEGRKCFDCLNSRGRLTKLPKRCAISHKTTSKDEGHNRESFIRKAQVMMMYGMMISVMVTLLLMILPP
jgi:predicted nucleic acid binding AN1-type Zn finger protein